MPGDARSALRSLAARIVFGQPPTTAVVVLGDPEETWRLIADPALWPLWMPSVERLVDPPRPPRSGAYYRVVRPAYSGRLGPTRGGNGTVVVDQLEDRRLLRWRVLGGRTPERYGVEVCDGELRADADGRTSAAALASILERESRP